MDINQSKILSVYFWKRSPSSVEEIDEVKITREKNTFSFHCAHVPDKKEQDCFFARLAEIIDDTEEEYRGMKYEDDKSDFNLKFYLEITFKDHTYLAIKGLYPFGQPHFKDIIDLFSSLI